PSIHSARSIMTTKTLRQWAGLQPPTLLDPTATALVLIDFQREYFDRAKLPIPNGAVAAANAALLVSAADKVGVKVIHVQHLAASPTSHLFAPGSSNAQFVDLLKPCTGEEIVVKSM